VTICSHGRKCVFAKVHKGVLALNDAGKTIAEFWSALPGRFPNIGIDEFIVMPNHLHGIICIETPNERAAIKAAPTLGQIIGAFKSITTNEYIRNVKTSYWAPFDKQLWQRNFYEHVIRTDMDLFRIREYIINNPAQWENDEYFSA